MLALYALSTSHPINAAINVAPLLCFIRLSPTHSHNGSRIGMSPCPPSSFCRCQAFAAPGGHAETVSVSTLQMPRDCLRREGCMGTHLDDQQSGQHGKLSGWEEALAIPPLTRGTRFSAMPVSIVNHHFIVRST